MGLMAHWYEMALQHPYDVLWNAIGFHPERTPLGKLHQRYVRELLQ